jgi:hypothetical protein
MTLNTITLQQIQTAYAELGEMIEKFKAQASTLLSLPAATIELRPGERYAGLILGTDGKPSHHLILLPGEAEDVNWKSALAWAEKAGGELPSRNEQALLFANLKSEFKGDWYWSGEQYSESSTFGQNFYDGSQYYGYKSAEARERAIRRVFL